MRRLPVLPAAGLLSACLLSACIPQVPPPVAAPAPANDACRASLAADWIGRATQADVATRIGTAVGHDRIRVIHPGDAVTMDHRPDRLNVELSDDGRIIRLRCG